MEVSQKSNEYVWDIVVIIEQFSGEVFMQLILNYTLETVFMVFIYVIDNITS